MLYNKNRRGRQVRTQGKEVCLLGYTFGCKGYKLYDLDTKRVFHSRDVHIFPFKDKSSSTSLLEANYSLIWLNSAFINPGPFTDLVLVQPDSTLDQTPQSSSFQNNSHSDDLIDSNNHSPPGTANNTSFVPDSEDSKSVQVQQPHRVQSNLRRSTRPRATPIWLQDFIQPNNHKHHADSSISHSLHSVITHPLIKAEDLRHLSSDFVASLMTVM